MTTIGTFIDTLKQDAAALWKKIEDEAKAAGRAVEAEAIAAEHAIAPFVEQDFVALMTALKSYGLSKVLDLARAEYSALSGQEKQGEVVTHLIQVAETLGHDITPMLLSAARTLAQECFVALGFTKPATT